MSSRPINLCGAAQALDHPHEDARPLGLASCSGVEDSGPRWTEPIKGESAPIRGGSPTPIMIMTIMHVLVKEFLCQGLMGWRPILECFSVRCAWVPMATSRHARP
jgi:hypothetical protein